MGIMKLDIKRLCGKTNVYSLLLIFIMLGCAPKTTPVYHIETPFSEDEFIPYAKKGTASIIGQAFMKTKGGDIKYAAGNYILLLPVTQYTTEIIRIALEEKVEEGGSIDNKDPRLIKYAKKTMADAEGKFEFNNIPSGEYYVWTAIKWQVPSQSGLRRTGGNISKRIRVKEGEKVKVILTP